jgi:hypothetical protein
MSNYTKSTNFLAKDSLPENDSGKIIKGSEFDTEFNELQIHVQTKADLASPALTGVPTAPTASPGTNTTQLATTAFVTAADTAILAANNTFTGTQTFKDNKFEITDDGDATKKLNLQLSGITTATTRTLTVPDKSGTIAVTTDLTQGSPLNAAANTVVSGSYAATSSATITITATNTFAVGQTVFIQFTNSSGSSLTNGDFIVVTASGSSFTITYGSSVTSAGTCITTRYGVIALATSTDLSVRTDTLRAVTPSNLTITRATVVSPMNTTNVTFSNIPAWVKRVTLLVYNASAPLSFRLGPSGGVVTTGIYAYTAGGVLSSNQTSNSNTTTGTFFDTAENYGGTFTFHNITGNTWLYAGTAGGPAQGARSGVLSGYVTLPSGPLSILQIVGTFTTGVANIIYE